MDQRKNAGYIITQSIKIGEIEIVFGKNDTRFGTEYVTWLYKNNSYIWGHYYNNEITALKDFLGRAQDELTYYACTIKQ